MSKEINMDIEVGDYVRTKRGEIFKVKEVNPTIGGKIAIVRKENGFIRRVDLEEEKHSKNIIDLIEPGDFVNGNKVADKYLYAGEKPVLETVGIEYNAYCLCEGDIREILTHEQYMQNCYTVERR